MTPAEKRALERQALDWVRRYGEDLLRRDPDGKWLPGTTGYVPTKYARAVQAAAKKGER